MNEKTNKPPRTVYVMYGYDPTDPEYMELEHVFRGKDAKKRAEERAAYLSENGWLQYVVEPCYGD